MSTYLLDVNLLLALGDPMHIDHKPAHSWFASTGMESWATCPITENAFVRIASHPRYPNRPGDAAAVLTILRQFCEAEGRRFWSEDVSLRDLILPNVVTTHKHINDVYLLGLAVHHGGRLATLDRRIPVTAIQEGEKALELITLYHS